LFKGTIFYYVTNINWWICSQIKIYGHFFWAYEKK